MSSAPAQELGEVPAAAAVASGETFFQKEIVDSTWINNWTYTCQPSAAINDTQITFQFPKFVGDNFPFIQKMKLKLRMKLVDENGDPPERNQTVCPINLFGKTLFSSVKLFLNETQVTAGANGLFPYLAYVEALINNGTDKKRGAMQLGGYYEDDIECWNQMDDTQEGPGWGERRSLFGELKIVGSGEAAVFQFDYRANEVTTIVEVNTEFSGCSTPMLNMVGGRLELMLNRPEFYLQCEADNVDDCVEKKYRLEIGMAELLIPVKTMSPTLCQGIEKTLSTKNQEYNTTRMDLRKIALAKGVSTFTTDNVKQCATSPDRMYLFLIPEAALSRAFGTSALRMCNYVGETVKTRAYLKSMRMTLNNESLESSEVAGDAVALDVRKLFEFYENMGMWDSDTATRIGKDEYAQGKYVVVYDLTKAKRAALSRGVIKPEAKDGALKLDLIFNKELPENAFLFVISEFHSKVVVDKNRNVTYRYLA